MKRLLGRLVVGLVLCLICFIAYSAQIFIIWPWYGQELSVELLILLIPFNMFVGMLLWNYYLCVNTDPGTVPSNWRPDTRSADGYEVKKLTGVPRYCRTCEQYKPPRAHHCRQCRKCVLRMDHHCPWINNCVGHFNYGHFIRFLFYVDISCTYHLAMVTSRVYDAMGRRYWDGPSGIELVFIVLNYACCIPVLLAVGIFSLYHFWSLSRNTTTIEGWEKDRAATLRRRGKIQEVKFPYHLGARRNFESVLGPNPLLWCWPITAHGSGVRFELADRDEDSMDMPSWPPQDPAELEQRPFELKSTPWTYENGSLNPDLQPSNSSLQGSLSKRKRKSQGRVAAVPPYHPDYDDSAVDQASSSSSADDSYAHYGSKPRIRRGSEGYEVKPLDREQMLQRYIESVSQEPGRYNVYEPEPGSESETSEGDNIPLGQRIEKWQTKMHV